jgi:hypothetical protein
MTRSTGGQCAAALLCTLIPLMAPALRGQTTPPPATPKPDEAADNASKPKRASLGLRMRALPLRSYSVMADSHSMNTTYVGKTPYDVSFDTTSSSPFWGGGLAFELLMGRRTFLTADFMFAQLRYAKATNTYWGVDNPETFTDERSHTALNESTTARLWDLPLMLHYRVGSSGILSHLYVAGGATAREITSIRTTNNLTDTGGTVTTNQNKTLPSKRNLLGAVVGIGFRFVDDFNFKVTPEIRYTRWAGATFDSDSTQSPRNQLELSIGITH